MKRHHLNAIDQPLKPNLQNDKFVIWHYDKTEKHFNYNI